MEKTKKSWWKEQQPPEHLSPRSRELWLQIVGRRVKSPERLALFQMALECLDRADQARALLAGAELLEQAAGAKMAHIHPAVRLEQQARAQFAKLWKSLALDFDGSMDGIDG